MASTRNAVRVSLLFVLGMALLALSHLPIADSAEERGAALLGPVTGTIATALRPISDVILHAGQLQRIVLENADLREEVARLEAEAAQGRDDRTATQQTRALRAAVGGAAGYLAAAVVVRDPAPGRNGVTVDRGASDGILVGQPVLGPAATLIGIVGDIAQHSARVRLLNDPNSAVAAVLQQSRTPGALAGSGQGLRLDFVPTGTTVAVNDLVLSSPLGGRLPPGLLIGRVAAVDSTPEELFQVIRVEPLADYSRVEHVLIVTSYVPGNAP